MVALSEQKIEIVRKLVETAPDQVVGSLHSALAQTDENSPLGGVRRLVEAEVQDRIVRNVVFQPIVPMCVGDGSNPDRLVFPARTLSLLWRGLKALAAPEVGLAAQVAKKYRPGEAADEVLDQLVTIAAEAVRTRVPGDFAVAAQVCDEARPNGGAQLALCLDLAHILRPNLLKLSEWVSHHDQEAGASARLAYKDGVAIQEDAGTRFFEMIAAQLAQPWMVLRIISAVMDRPSERYLHDSELGGFGERVVRDIEERLKALGTIDADGGPKAARAAAREVELITTLTNEVETFIELSREHGWGKEIVGFKKGLAATVEGHLRAAEKALSAALPTQTVRLARMQQERPKLTAMPDPVLGRRASMYLAFIAEIRSSANYGGFASARAKAIEKLGEHLDLYVEEVLDHLRTGEAADAAVGFAFLETCAQFAALLRDAKAGELVRRRAATLRKDLAKPNSAEAR